MNSNEPNLMKQFYSCSKFTECSENLLAVEDIPNNLITLRSAEQITTAQSFGTGKEIFKCTFH